MRSDIEDKKAKLEFEVRRLKVCKRNKRGRWKGKDEQQIEKVFKKIGI